MRLVLDTNVIVSGLIFPDSIPGQALTIAKARCVILQSAESLDELADVFRRPKFDRWIPFDVRAEAFIAFARLCEMVKDLPRLQACRDEKDNRLLELAVGGRAAILVSGDDDLLSLNPFNGLEVLSPRQFVARFSKP